mmetsp:Transcript_28960/g.43744  ORF Transcript_28960/g.43744 Transcript_28960/m.43744 type:complete len:369 (+) Transcript_28960:136-1242(+)
MANDIPCSGRLPSWWLEGVPHDTHDLQLRQRRLSSQGGSESDDSYYSKEKSDHSETSSSASELTDTKSPSRGDMIMHQTMVENSRIIDKHAPGIQSEADEIIREGTKSPRKLDIRMTSEEEAAAVEARRIKSMNAEKFGQSFLKKRIGDSTTMGYKEAGSQGLYGTDGGLRLNIKMTSEEEAAAVEARREQYTPSMKIGPELLKKRASNRTVECNINNDSGKSIIVKSEKQKVTPQRYAKTTTQSTPKDKETPSQEARKMNFVGLSPFDFAMKQKKLMKERREKERRDKEALARHHGGTLELEKSTMKKAKEIEERKKRSEAEQNLKAFKAIGVEKKDEHAAELKKLQMQDKQRKKEAEDHLKGYRER